MGTVHEFRRKPANKGQFEGPVPGIIPLRRAPRRKPLRRRPGLLAAAAWIAILAAITAYVMLT